MSDSVAEVTETLIYCITEDQWFNCWDLILLLWWLILLLRWLIILRWWLILLLRWLIMLPNDAGLIKRTNSSFFCVFLLGFLRRLCLLNRSSKTIILNSMIQKLFGKGSLRGKPLQSDRSTIICLRILKPSFFLEHVCQKLKIRVLDIDEISSKFR